MHELLENAADRASRYLADIQVRAGATTEQEDVERSLAAMVRVARS